MISEDILYLSVSELSQKIRDKQLSPVELTQAYLDRIHKYNDRFNAFVTVTADLALAQARAAEKEIAADRWLGPLHGIPWGAKDLLATKGIPTGWGTKFLKDQLFDRDATIVQRLHAAGAVMLGKTHMVEFAGCLGYRFANASVAGPGRNPWDPTRWTGGSSSGSAAAVAGGLAAFAIGTETWGSILCPSAFCGLTGLRPTYGVVPRTGGMVGAYTFDKIGPLARSAADCRTILQTIAGADPLDASSSSEKLDLRAGSGKPLSQIKAAYIPTDWGKGTEPEVKAAFEAGVATLKAAGLQMEEAKFPEYPASEVSGLLIGIEALTAFEPFLQDGRAKLLVDDLAWRQPAVAEPITGADAMKLWRMRLELQGIVAEFYAKYDVVVTPNFKSVSPPVDVDLNVSLPYADPAGAIGVGCGLPAIALPAGPATHGLPASFQIMGAPFSEATLLDLGDLYQERTKHHRAHPKLI